MLSTNEQIIQNYEIALKKCQKLAEILTKYEAKIGTNEYNSTQCAQHYDDFMDAITYFKIQPQSLSIVLSIAKMEEINARVELFNQSNFKEVN